MKRFTVYLLTCSLCVINIAELSSALIVQSHSKQIQIKEEDIPELGKNIPLRWFFRQVDFGTFQPIIDNYFPRIFKKTAVTVAQNAIK